MKGSENKGPPEPVGIVIAPWPRIPQATVFAAYVWAPPAKSEDEPKAA